MLVAVDEVGRAAKGLCEGFELRAQFGAERRHLETLLHGQPQGGWPAA